MRTRLLSLSLLCCACSFAQSTSIGGSRVITGGFNIASESGSGNTYVGTVGIAGYVTGMQLHFLATHTNAGGATLNVDNLGSVPILMNDGVTPLPAGAIQANAMTSVIYNGTNFQLSSAAASMTTSGSGIGFNIATATPLYYYPHFGTNTDRYMHQAYSTDAKAFHEMSYTDTYQNTIDQKDISMFYDKTSGTFYYAGTSGSTTGVYIWTSKDMVNFSTPVLMNIPGLPGGVTNIWAPEFFADPTSGNEYVFVAVSSNNITSFTTYVVPWVSGSFTGNAQSVSISGTSEGYVIDNFPRKIGNTYYLFYSNGSNGHSVQRLAFATSSNLLGPYTQQSSGDLGGFAASISGGGGVEAPTVLPLPNGCNRVYVDTFGPSQNGYIVRWADSCDTFSTFTAPTILNIDKQSQHGTVYAITDPTEAAIVNTAIIGSTGGSFKGVSTNTLNLGADVSLTSTGSGLLQFNSPASGMNMIFQPSAPGLHAFQFYDNTVNWGNFDFTDNLGVWDYLYASKSMRIDVGLQLDSARNYAKPGCDANHRGVLWFLNNGASADDMQLCNSGGSGYTWSSLLQGGSGSTGAPSGGFVIGSPSNSGYPSLALQGDTKTWDIEAPQSTSDVPGHLIFNQSGGGRYFDMNAVGIPKFPALAASSGTANLCVDSTGLVKNSGCGGSSSSSSGYANVAPNTNTGTSSNIVVIGDSHMYGTGQTNNIPSQLSTVQSYTVTNLAVPSTEFCAYWSDSSTHESSVDTLFNPLARSNVLVIEGGGNDMLNNNTGVPAVPYISAQQTYDCQVGFAKRRRALGWKVVLYGMYSRSQTGYNGETGDQLHDQLNALYNAGWQSWADSYVNIGLDPNVGQDGDSTNGYFQSDHIHVVSSYTATLAASLSAAINRAESGTGLSPLVATNPLDLVFTSTDPTNTSFDWKNSHASMGGIHNYQWVMGTDGNLDLGDTTSGTTTFVGAFAPSGDFVAAGALTAIGGISPNVTGKTKGTCSSAIENQMWVTKGSASTNAVFQICQNQSGTYQWVTH